ncbi:ras-related protein Rab-30 isoform X1 [Felis catus]|uniref:RAB30, member RAS oncogene family n=1 Tax=Felis catus TaxID=9685 RepID=A0ABI7ZGZ9_FELCA|nr:ras-related protein Rab-30 isoform X1 [Felis catus]XP_044894609.1 ras-related protein Rab-30 isoform X1 [Felis catus]XP_044894610.1 ras-related protein Rab-30 isoform X1 [Felis catus]XP_060461477.1 ras-related protein Rab-30 isoform X1 [Panthera onca]XP_060461479.1 ras-related protein Rab-30 isoform X1 [Panthera onca]XP_060461480.1 ras-related protein Rab-30 isoform X1 [Panthera onca]XP_060461481.1 ras-related protein Rab-30 isoform X1 [Panthera onca]
MSMEDYDFLFKIVLIGNAGVGKTCLVRRFTQGLFPPGQGATIGVDFMIKTVEINGEKVKVSERLSNLSMATQEGRELQIWDTAGQERFRSITQSYYRSANALILTYDITCEESFRCLPEWLREIEQYASNKVITVLVGNKIDLAERREVSQQRAEEFSEAQDMYYLETSAKESDNVEKLFLDLACRLISEARQNTLVNNVSSPLPGEGKSISYLTCCNFN